MAFNDTLFQLGMDLTRSSTTQTEDLVAHESRAVVADHSGGRELVSDASYAGTHLIIDLFGASRLDDPVHVERAFRACAAMVGRDVLSLHLHRHDEHGLTGFVALEGGHLTLNARPGAGYAAVDLLVAGDARPHLVVDVLKDAFRATDVVLKGHQRGIETGGRGWNVEAQRPDPVRLQKTPRLMRTKRVA